jgi:hypothetical protein
MDDQPAIAAPKDEKHSINWGFVVWPLVILVLYVLSFGPVIKLLGSNPLKPSVDDALKTVYYPLLLAYSQTLLHKPLGMYLHLWAPEFYDKNGDDAFIK